MTSNHEIRETAEALVENHGPEAAASYAVGRITELYDEGNLYELSIWREIRKAVADLTKGAELAVETKDDK